MASQDKNNNNQELEESQKEEQELKQNVSFQTMPRKFLVTEKESSKGKMFAVISVVLIAILGVGGGIFYLNWNIQKQKTKVVVETFVTQEQTEVTDSEITEPEELPVNEAPEADISFVVDYVDSKDTDQDGLTDLEETIFNTFASRPDSDGDGHIDSNEILNFYNPSGLAPADLIDSGLIQAYENENFNYVVFYPSSWQIDNSDSTGKIVKFNTQMQGEGVNIIVEENPDKKGISDWYIDKNPTVKPEEIKTFTSRNGLRGVVSKNGLINHLIKPESASITSEEEGLKVYTIEYIPGDRIELNYRKTYEMMIRSFTIIDSAPKEEKDLPSTAGYGTEETLTP